MISKYGKKKKEEIFPINPNKSVHVTLLLSMKMYNLQAGLTHNAQNVQHMPEWDLSCMSLFMVLSLLTCMCLDCQGYTAFPLRSLHPHKFVEGNPT